MKTIGLEQATLNSCVDAAQRERILVTHHGKPVAVIIGIDKEQRERGKDDIFWKLIEERRMEETISREDLEKELDGRNLSNFKKEPL